MKKLLSLATAIVVFTSASFANTNPTDGSSAASTSSAIVADKNVSDAFATHFKKAQSVSWSKTTNYSTANFEINGQYLAAHFTPDAKMIGVSRNITKTELPMSLTRDLNKYINKYWISELFEYATPGSDDYYVTLENADKKLILKSEAGSFSIYKQVNKAG